MGWVLDRMNRMDRMKIRRVSRGDAEARGRPDRMGAKRHRAF